MALVFLETDDTTPSAAWAFPETAAGAVSAAHGVHLWGDKGVPGNAYRNVRLALEAEITSGVWAETGIPLVDRQEIWAHVTGSANPQNDPLFPARSVTGWQPLGAGARMSLGDIRGDTAIYLELCFAPSIVSGTGSSTAAWRIRLITGAAAVGRGDHTGEVGVIQGRGNPDVTEWVDAPTALATGTPDDVANVGARSWMCRGQAASETGTPVTLSQSDGSSATLATGEAYWAVISQDPAGTAPTATKGVKDVAADAVLPALPAGELPIASVLVQYGAGGSAIEDGDITVLGVDGRGGLTYDAASLVVSVGAVKALLPTVYVEQPAATTLTLAASDTSQVYIASTGEILATLDALPPAGSLVLWEVVTDPSGVTTATDRRIYLGDPGLWAA